MAFGKNTPASNQSAPPKKADIILKANQEISSKQDEIIRQSKLTDSRIDAAIEMFSKNMQDMTFLAKQSSEIFNRLQNENSALKQELLYLAKQNENIYSGLAEKIAELSERVEKLQSGNAAPRSVITGAAAEIDYDKLAEKVAAIVGVREDISPDYIASKVAEQIVVPAIADDGCDDEKIASRVAELIKAAPSAVDEDELADAIAMKVGCLKAEDFEILVDDDGCASISEEIASRLDYGAISDAVSDKILRTLDLFDSATDIDYDEMAAHISEKIKLPELNEDSIADKAAAVLSNYLPEVDSDEIAERVSGTVIDVLNTKVPELDGNVICKNITEKLIEAQSEDDYDIVIDEEGMSQMAEMVSRELENKMGNRLEEVELKLAEIKKMLESGIALAGANEIATAETAVYEKSENLVTVSDLVENGEPEEQDDETDFIDEIDEQLSDAEVMPDGIADVPGGVDFVNMMKYNRSFIARIIQSTDEQKRYYGAVKHALLSYRKVNSNIAWGAERFNKGRETVARFKIRGKTLCLYLALDPNVYKTSVYHHADVSDNKSMSGTPMMVKIKSPLGVKKAIRLIDIMLSERGAVKREIPERDYATMYPYETIEQLIEDGLVKDVSKNK